MAAAAPIRPSQLPRQPGDRPALYPRRILLAVAGLSPQVVTETLYALAQAGPRAALPTEVHVLTTRAGAEQARLSLLKSGRGWFDRLLRDHRLPAVAFTERHIHVLRDGQRRMLADIRTPQDNERLADNLCALVREFTAAPDTQLHVSLAGGRKTMGYYAGTALSLFGRAQDRLSHVLVSPAPFEAHPEFFYPARSRRVIYDRDRKPLDAAAARVTLADIPFVRLRAQINELDGLLRGQVSFSATVNALNRRPAPQALLLTLQPEECRLRAGGVELKLPPRQMAFYLWLAERARAALPGIACPGKGKLLDAPQFMAAYSRVGGADAVRVKFGMDAEYFMETKSRLNAALRRAAVDEAYYVQHQGPPRAGLFALALPPAAITIEEIL